MSLKKSLPDLYYNIINRQILNLPVKETKATCHNCLRARDQRFEYTYNPQLKCCTFIPFLPNYAVGGILSEKIQGYEIILELIAHRNFILPIGIFPSFKYQAQFLNKKKADFGNDAHLLCQYYDRNLNHCSIWKYRGVVCTTFFCRSDYGVKGLNFWDVLKDYLSYVEMALAEDCLVMKDFSPRDLSDQLDYLNKREFKKNELNKTALTVNEYKKYWNGYVDPEQFYISCYELVKSQNRHSFKEIIGLQGLKLEKMVLESFSCLSK